MNANLRIFLVDDDDDALILLRHSLRNTAMDYHLRSFRSGEEALHALQAERCDVLVTNNQMKEVDGLTLIREVRKLSPRLPVVMVSNSDHLEAPALEAGANAFLTLADRRRLGKVIEEIAPKWSL